MNSKIRIDSILSDIKELEQLIVNVRDEEVYPVAFFSKSFDIAHHLLKDLHLLEGEQIESLHKQMDEYRRMIDTVSYSNDSKRAEEPSLLKKTNASGERGTLNDMVWRKNYTDLRKAFSLNDRFHFQRELFKGDEDRMDRTISELNEIESFDESLAFIRNTLRWNDSDPTVAEFIALLEKRFQ